MGIERGVEQRSGLIGLVPDRRDGEIGARLERAVPSRDRSSARRCRKILGVDQQKGIWRNGRSPISPAWRREPETATVVSTGRGSYRMKRFLLPCNLCGDGGILAVGLTLNPARSLLPCGKAAPVFPLPQLHVVPNKVFHRKNWTVGGLELLGLPGGTGVKRTSGVDADGEIRRSAVWQWNIRDTREEALTLVGRWGIPIHWLRWTNPVRSASTMACMESRRPT